jgi:hypothetical protein
MRWRLVVFLAVGQAPFVSAATLQNFDTPGTPYMRATSPECPGPGAEVLPGGAKGQFIRLAHAAPALVRNCNTIAFDRSDVGAAGHVLVDFRFRMTPPPPSFFHRADGMGFALLNTARYATTGPVIPTAPHEEPNFDDSLGVGFDIHYEPTRHPEEPSNNHVSIHYDGQLLQAFHVRGLDLASGAWIHARIVIRPGDGFSDVSVSLTAVDPPGGTFQSIKVRVPGLVPYEGRAYFGARSGGESANHDLDDVSVEYLPATLQDFDGAGTPYATTSQATCNPPGATLLTEAPRGRFLRLAHQNTPTPNCNTAALARDVPGLYTRVEAEFDFRMAAASIPAADGIGFALLNTAEYDFAGAASPASVSEDPDFRRSVGVGFDINQAQGEPSANHVSVHYDGMRAVWDVDPAAVNLSSGQWIHARIVIEMGAAPGVTVRLTSTTGSFENTVAIPVLTPYEGRLLLGARSGYDDADHDVDDIRARFSGEPDPAVYGRWSPLLRWPSVPIHMHLLPTGKVLFWDRHSDRHHGGGIRDDDRDGEPRLWDPVTGEITQPDPPDYDIFCGGHSFLADGRLFVSGGHLRDNVGLPHAAIYDPFAPVNPWQMVDDMHAGRWYPTNTTLDDGRVLVVSGDIMLGLVNSHPEVFDPGSGTWDRLVGARRELPLYPWMYLAPDGRAFAAGPHQDARFLDVKTQTWSAPFNSQFVFRDVGTSAMFEAGRVLIAGGSFDQAPHKLTETIDLDDPLPHWSPAGEMSYGRRYPNSTLLPDGEVLVTGGTNLPGNLKAGAVFVSEAWDPASRSWSLRAAHKVQRLYHSTALLLPDGRVLAGGGGHPKGADEGLLEDHPDVEIYSPPYLFHGDGPRLTSAPGNVIYGQPFAVVTPDAGMVTQVVWIRLSSVTHAFNQDQRLVRLSITGRNGDLQVTAPSDPRLCPPGYYLMFLLNAQGIPSLGHMIRIGPP